MSIHKRTTTTKGTTYVVRWRDPKPREKTFARKLDAERYERSVLHKIDTGTYRDPRLGKVTFRQWHDRWWPTIETSDRAPNTLAQYETLLRLHVLPHLGNRRLGELRLIDFEEWLSGLRGQGLSPSTVRTSRTLASMVLTSAVDYGLIPANPLAGRKLLVARKSQTARALTAKQVETLVKAFDEHYRALILVLAYGGLRPGEAAALRRRHLDDLGQLMVEGGLVEHRGKLIESSTKTHRARVVPLPDSVVTALRRHLKTSVDGDPEAPMFTMKSGTRLRLSNFRSVWDAACDRAGLPDWATPYVLRHTAASLMAQRGVPVTTAAAVLGHDPSIYLSTYAHLYPGDLRAAAAAMDDARSDARSGKRNVAAFKSHAGIARGRTTAGGATRIR